MKETSRADDAALADGLGFRLSRLARRLRTEWSRELADLGLTPPLAAVLRGVHEEPGTSLRALGRMLGTDAMSVKRCADELEALDLIRSGSLEEDRRPRTLTLTTKGRAMVKRINVRVALRERDLETVLGTSNREALIKLVSDLEATLDASDVANSVATRAMAERARASNESRTEHDIEEEVN